MNNVIINSEPTYITGQQTVVNSKFAAQRQAVRKRRTTCQIVRHIAKLMAGECMNQAGYYTRNGNIANAVMSLDETKMFSILSTHPTDREIIALISNA